MTVKKPNCLVVDLRGRMQAAMAYMMFSRVQEMDQLFILGSLPEQKIFPSPDALEELERMNAIAINNSLQTRNPLISSTNILSLRAHFDDMKHSTTVPKSDVICFQETWIEPNQENLSNFKMDGFNCHFVSLGRGKGLATYYKENYKFQDEVKNPMYQIAKIGSKEVDIINVYRSSNAPAMFIDDLKSLISQERETHILGDFNFCYKSERNNKIAKVLDELGFR